MNSSGGTGAEVIYALRNSPTLAQSVLNNIGATGQKTRRIYQRRLPSDPSRDYYFIHRNTGTTEPLIVEYGFIDDTPENNQFLNNHYKELAEAVIKSILEYKGIPYTAPSTTTSSNTYTVKAGDTLYKIAQMYNTTVDQIKTLNNLSNNNLSIGQKLTLPSATRNTYTVKAGDTLYSIASRNNTTVQALRDLNRLNNDILSIGQVLMLPTTELLEIPSVGTTYTVQAGDTLYSIAKRYDTTVDQIKSLNRLTSNSLVVGQVLKIPTTTSVEIPTTTKNYTVKPGDTLYSIAKNFNTTVNNIKEFNHLSNNMISVGQNLLLS